MADNIRDGVVFGCHCELEPREAPDECVIDSPEYAGPQDCLEAKRLVAAGKTKWDCPSWSPIHKPAFTKKSAVSLTIDLIDGLKAESDPSNRKLIEELEACLNRHGVCHKCFESFNVHNGDGSCVED